ncbi:MAG: DegT/DnrJ/EryC1/StrS aminotransferase family protein [Planctomycetes bacterium]|nr:DegT/DnrJ/EryC1/StrS aminotransferase family protein [Planctomycetota bacterium]
MKSIHHSMPTIGEDERKNVLDVLESGFVGHGKKCAEFEQEIAALIEKRFAIATNSGTAALHLALIALEVGEGDEVIVPSYVCTALLNAVHYVRATPVVVDVDPADACLSRETAMKKVTSRTRAIIAAHVLGAPCDVPSLKDFNVPIIEDCAMNLGAKVHGKPAGAQGDLTVSSFYATKYLTSAHGGFVATSDERMGAKIKDLVDFDNREDYIVRYNAQMSDLQAALGLAQLRRLPEFVQKRRELAMRYTAALAGELGALPSDTDFGEHAYFRYCIPCPDGMFAGFQRHFKTRGIEAKPPVYRPLHRYLGLPDEEFPNSSRIQDTWLSIPIYPSLTEEDIRRIEEALRSL